MKKLRTKVVSGVQFGDVSNASVRNVLTKISEQLHEKVTDNDILKSLKFFDYKCPYTRKTVYQNGQLLDNAVTDHIVPQNQDYCGLNVPGNLVICDKEANDKKNKITADEFLLKHEFFNSVDPKERKRRLQKIKDYQAECGYDPEEVKRIVRPLMLAHYSFVRENQQKCIDNVMNELKKNNFVVNAPKAEVNKTQKNSSNNNNGVRIGTVVKSQLFDLLANGVVSKEEIAKLKTTAYSKQVFNFRGNYSLLYEVSSLNEKLRNRVYAKAIIVRGEELYVCSQWYSDQMESLISFIDNHKTKQ